MARLGCRIDMQRITGRVGRCETVCIPDERVFSGDSGRRDDDEESVHNHNDVALNVGVDGLKCVGWKRIDVDQEPQCPEATSKCADAWPGGGKLESLAAKQT